MRPIFHLIALTLFATALSAKTIYVDMVADLFHRGHVALIKKAKQEGDFLIVGIHSDEDVMTYKRRPIMTMQERMDAVRASGLADKVIGHAPLRITEEFLNKQGIDLIVHGDDISQESLDSMYAIPIKLGKFKLVPYTQGISSTKLINRMKESVNNPKG